MSSTVSHRSRSDSDSSTDTIEDEGFEVELGFIDEDLDIQQEYDETLPISHYASNDVALNTPHWQHWDAGRIGGRPLWLIPSNLPTTKDLSCTFCAKVMKFMIQFYAPLDSDQIRHENAFHRMIYVFCCPDGDCVQRGSVHVLRAQLPRENGFYTSSMAENTDISTQDRLLALSGVDSRCAVCGIGCSITTSAGLAVCCNRHKNLVDTYISKPVPSISSVNAFLATPLLVKQNILFPEMDVVSEPEPCKEERKIAAQADKVAVDAKYASIVTKSTQKNTKENSDDQNNSEELDITELTQTEILHATGGKLDSDTVMRRFNRRIAVEPSQVVRYCRWHDDSTLWAGATGIPTKRQYTVKIYDSDGEYRSEIPSQCYAPPCANCGAPRRFELQVMPQILNYVIPESASTSIDGKQDLDFGTIAIYTCSRACASSGYQAEFGWVQPSS